MRRLTLIVAFSLGALWTARAEANPFRTRFVCVPPVQANAYELEFFIRDQGQCADNEMYMEVRSGGDGSVLVIPVAQDALTPEEQRDLDRYRRFFGGSRPEGAPE